MYEHRVRHKSFSSSQAAADYVRRQFALLVRMKYFKRTDHVISDVIRHIRSYNSGARALIGYVRVSRAAFERLPPSRRIVIVYYRRRRLYGGSERARRLAGI